MQLNFSIALLSFIFSFVNVLYSYSGRPPDAGIPADSLHHTTSDTLTVPVDSSLKDSTTVRTTPARKKKQELTDTVNYEADKIDYDAAAKHLILIGNAKIEYQKMTLFADTIRYYMDQDIFTATGMPQLLEGGDTTVGDYMVYNIKTHRGRVNYASTHLSDAVFNGNRIIKSAKNELYVQSGDYTTCAAIDTPHYTFYGRKIKVVPNDKMISKPVVFNIGEAPVAMLPFFIFPIERKRRSGILSPVWGGHPTGGGYLDNIGYYYAPNDYIDVTLATRVYEFSEFVTNLSSSYARRYLLNGSFSGRYVFNTDFQRRKKNWAISFSHNQNITPDGKTRLSGGGNFVSEKTFYQQFSEDSSELREQNLRANLSLSHELTSINGSLNLSYKRAHNLKTDVIQEELPSFTFNLPSRPLIPVDKDSVNDSVRWFNKIYWGYNAAGIVNHTRPGASNDSLQESYHPGMNQSVSLSAPQKLFNVITINPTFSANNATLLGYIDTIKGYDTTYDTVEYVISHGAKDNSYTGYTEISRDTVSVPDSIRIVKNRMQRVAMRDSFPDRIANVTTWNAGVSISTICYGLFPLRFLNFVGLRHTLTPSIGYTFNPEHNLNRSFYECGIQPPASHKRSQLVTMSISNILEGKTATKGDEGEKPVEKKFTIINCGLSANYNFEAQSRKWSNLSLNASTGFKNLRVNSNASYWLYDEQNYLTMPTLSNVSLEFSIGTLNAKGTLWGGDLLVLDSLQPDDKIKYANIGKNTWNISISPSYSYSMSRSSPSEMFTPNKRYGLSSSANINFTRDWSLQWSSTYNFQENQWVQNSIHLSCDLECWDMQFQWRPEKLNPGYYFKINIKKIPEIKWEQRRG